MPPINSMFDRLQAIFNVLAGVEPQQSMPKQYSEPTLWETAHCSLQLPTVWRRGQSRVRNSSSHRFATQPDLRSHA